MAESSFSSIPLPNRELYQRHKTPTVIQMEATECGAASLCIILGYFGRHLPLEEARVACSISRDGSNAYNILRAGENLGLHAEGYNLGLRDLYQLSLPLIAFWNFEHFLVIEGFSKKHVYINDPASGPRRITYEELNACFTGIALTFKPSKEFKKSPRTSNLHTDAMQYLKLFKAPLLFTLLIGLLAIVPQLAMIVLSQVFVDNIVVGKVYSWSQGIMLGIALTALLATGISYLETWITTRLSIQLSTLLSGKFVWHTLRLPILFYVQRYGGEVASRINLNDAVANTLVNQVLPTLVNLVFAFIFALVMFYYDVQITLIAISIVFLNLFLMRYLYRARSDAYANYRQNVGRLTSFAIGGLESIESVKAVGGEHQFLAHYGGLYAQSLNTLQKISRSDLILGSVTPFISSLGSISVLLIGTWRILEGHLTVGEFVALQILFSNFTTPILNLVNINQTLQLLDINLNRLEDVLSHPEDPQLNQQPLDDQQLSQITPLHGYVEVKNLTFGFSPLDPPLLEDINLTLDPGERVALVGLSGCGKSTLIKLIGGLLKPWSGDVLFDQTPYLECPREVLIRSVAIVQQHSYLLDDTIQNNLSLLDPMPDQKVLLQAAQDACIHDEIMQRPGGFQSLIEKKGYNFSGGQRQRLEIACALFRQPSFLILDEATSGLDSGTERQVLDNVRRRGCSCLIVSHRLSTSRDCDKIIVLNKGKIVQQGTHDELMQQPGLYQTLVRNEDFNSSDLED